MDDLRHDPHLRSVAFPGPVLGPVLGVLAGFLLSAACERMMAPEPPAAPAEVIAAPAPPMARPVRVSAKTAPERPETVFEVRRSRGSTNLFVLEARARPEDQGIAMAVDTGAEVTILRQSDAMKVGAQLEPLYDSEVRAVGSTLSMKGGRVPAMTAGGVDFADTRVLIGPDNLPYSLLGQPEIARLGRVEFEGDVLRIHPTFQPASMD